MTADNPVLADLRPACLAENPEIAARCEPSGSVIQGGLDQPIVIGSPGRAPADRRQTCADPNTHSQGQSDA